MTEKIKWGIVSTGNISGKFAEALQQLDEAELLAVASRDVKTAREFAGRYGISKAYGSYAELAADPEVDVVYIGTPHTLHLENSVMFMRAGKAVLCEKALTINALEAEQMIRVAREEDVFLMEAMVTRHLPIIKRILGWISEGAIGDVRMVKASFCKRSDYTPEQRHLNPELGGGSLLDLGVYGISFASMVINKPPESVVGYAHIGPLGSDEQGVALMKYDRGELAELSFALRTNGISDARVFGTKGHIQVDEFFSIPTKATLFREGRAPEPIEDPSTGGGLTFEAEEVMRCLKAGLKESPRMPLDESLQIMRIMDEIRAPWEMTYPNDDSA
ncbi:MAG: Gfo/Idh/MocA family oxidoreductase [Bacteroidota bacterium]